MSEGVRNAVIQYIASVGETPLATIPQWAQENGLDLNEVTAEIKSMLAVGVIYYIRKGTVVVNPKKARISGSSQQQMPKSPMSPRPPQPGGYRFWNLKI